MTQRWIAALCLCLSAAALGAPKFTIHGQPIMGSFAVTWAPEDVRQALGSGINLFFCYDRRAGGRLLSPEHEAGAMIHRAGAKAMGNLCWAPAGYRLGEDATATATEVQLVGPLNLRDPGMFWMGDEAVRYQKCVKGRLLACQRGADGTTPAPHPRGEYIVRPDQLVKAVLATKDMPNLWGYWIVDDKKGNQRAALRNVYRLIKQHDVGKDGRPLNHVVVAGMASESSLTNFDAGVCDMVGIYTYPGHRGAYRTDQTARRMTRMLPIMEERSPGIPFMGIYQAFTGPRYQPKPTRVQLRKQIEDFAHFGASAFMAYSWRMIPDRETGKDRGTLRNLPDLRAEVEAVIADMRSGKLVLDRPRPRYAPRPEGKPDVTQLEPLLSFHASPDAHVPRPGGPDAQPQPGPDGSTWLHLRFAQYNEGKSQWPSVRFEARHMTHRPALSTAGWLVAQVHNYQDADSEIGFSIRDSRGSPWWARYYPLLPATTTTYVSVPLAEVRGLIDLADLPSITALMRRPPVATHLAIRGLYLAPAQFAVVSNAAYPCHTGGPAIDGSAADACWQQAKKVALEDSALDAAPVRPVTFRAVRAGKRLSFLFQAQLLGEEPRCAKDDSDRAWPVLDDTIQLLLAGPKQERWVRIVFNATGRRRVTPVGMAAEPQIACSVANGVWTAEVGIDVGDAPAPQAAWGLQVQRHDTQTGHLVWPKAPGLPVGVEPLGCVTPVGR